MNTLTTDLLRTGLACAVSLRIAEIATWTVERRIETAREQAHVVTAHGDDLQYGGKHTAAAFNALALGIACAAYQPGGITFLGDHYEADPAVQPIPVPI